MLLVNKIIIVFIYKQFTENENRYFEITTYIGCGCSITALLITMFCFVYLKLLRKKANSVYINSVYDFYNFFIVIKNCFSHLITKNLLLY